MKKVLIYLLGAQIVIAALVFFSSRQAGYTAEPVALLSDDGKAVSLSSIDSLTIEDNEKNSITFEQKNGKWSIKDETVVLDEGKLKSLLNTFKDAMLKWPIATSDGSHARFEVASDKYQRKLTFKTKEDHVIYLGSSPGFRKTYVRQDNNKAVYSVSVNTYDAPAELDQWYDQSLLASGEVTEITGKDYSAKLEEQQWVSLTPMQDSTKIDSDKLSSLATSLDSLRVSSIEKAKIDDSYVSLGIKSDKGTFTYQLGNKDDKYLIKRNDMDTVFSIYKTTYDQIIESLTLNNILATHTETNNTPTPAANVDIPTPIKAPE